MGFHLTSPLPGPLFPCPRLLPFLLPCWSICVLYLHRQSMFLSISSLHQSPLLLSYDPPQEGICNTANDNDTCPPTLKRDDVSGEACYLSATHLYDKMMKGQLYFSLVSQWPVLSIAKWVCKQCAKGPFSPNDQSYPEPRRSLQAMYKGAFQFTMTWQLPGSVWPYVHLGLFISVHT